MSIQDIPELDQKINGQSKNGNGFDKPMYCKKCGKYIVMSKDDGSGGEDRTFNRRLNMELCLECFRKKMNEY